MHSMHIYIWISTTGPFVPALTNGPHVSYATWVTHMQLPTYITVHYRDGTQTFDAEWAVLHTLPKQHIHFPCKSPYRTPKGTRAPRYTVMTNCITSLHLVTLPYEIAVITITWWEICTPYQAADSDRLIWSSLITFSYAHHTGPVHIWNTWAILETIRILTLLTSA